MAGGFCKGPGTGNATIALRRCGQLAAVMRGWWLLTAAVLCAAAWGDWTPG